MLEEQIQMVDLHGQYLRFKEEINGAMQAVTDSCAFIILKVQGSTSTNTGVNPNKATTSAAAI